MTAIKPGVFVEVIDASPPDAPPELLRLLVNPPPPLSLGDVHLVYEVFACDGGGYALDTDKAPLALTIHGGWFGYAATRFRLIHEPKADAFSALLVVPTAPIKEPVAA